ncbi:MAG: stage II sporulation protein D [Firmicutes bacterium]|nr:stage II sporulation protein D [Bacillota bacterium]
MKKLISFFLLLTIFLIIILPTLIVRGCSSKEVKPPVEIDRAPIESPAGEITIKVFSHKDNELMEMPLEEYLVGVVAAEMPASFAVEALKAQAVVARTYTVNQMRLCGGRGCDRHPEADICTDSTCCQAWENEKSSLAKWHSDGANYYNKIRSAVRTTAGKVITYEGKLIEAVFHSTCGGHTENSEDVWTGALPYLRGVPCNYCADSRWTETQHEFTSAAFREAIVPYVSVLPVSAGGRPLLEAGVRSATGRLKSVLIAGEKISGRDFRTALKLPSTNVSWQITDKKIIFTAKGYGHGVGLCQYGANGLAKQNKIYTEIIQHYYTGVTITDIPSPSA